MYDEFHVEYCKLEYEILETVFPLGKKNTFENLTEQNENRTENAFRHCHNYDSQMSMNNGNVCNSKSKFYMLNNVDLPLEMTCR